MLLFTPADQTVQANSSLYIQSNYFFLVYVEVQSQEGVKSLQHRHNSSFLHIL